MDFDDILKQCEEFNKYFDDNLPSEEILRSKNTERASLEMGNKNSSGLREPVRLSVIFDSEDEDEDKEVPSRNFNGGHKPTNQRSSKTTYQRSSSKTSLIVTISEEEEEKDFRDILRRENRSQDFSKEVFSNLRKSLFYPPGMANI